MAEGQGCDGDCLEDDRPQPESLDFRLVVQYP